MRMLVSPAALKRFASLVLTCAGARKEEAEVTAEALVFADLRGITSHGVRKLPTYVKRLEMGGISPGCSPAVQRDTGGSFCVYDGANGLGPFVATGAMRECIRRANFSGLGLVPVRRSNHFGAASFYSLMAVDKDMIGIVLSNASPRVAPFGSMDPLLGTNPLSVAIPAGTFYPVVLDMAVTNAAYGKLEMAALRNERIPGDWALDSSGRPTTSAAEAIKGVLLPMGGPKGYGLGLVVDILSACLSGAASSSDVTSMSQYSLPQNLGHFMMAIDIGAFMDRQEFKSRVDRLLGRIKKSRPLPDRREVFYPGELEALMEKERSKNGVPLEDDTVESLKRLAERFQIEWDLS